MIHRLLKIYIFTIILFTDFVMFADDDPGIFYEDEYGVVTSNVEDEAPINHRLLFLGIAGIAFMLYYFRKKHQPITE